MSGWVKKERERKRDQRGGAVLVVVLADHVKQVHPQELKDQAQVIPEGEALVHAHNTVLVLRVVDMVKLGKRKRTRSVKHEEAKSGEESPRKE